MSEHDKEKDVDSETGVETTGHEWDGIKELNNPLPRWWLWTFYLTIAWGLWYVIAYPAWPLINGATAGYLGFSTRANVAADIAAFDEKNADLRAALTEVDLTKLEENEELSRFAVAGGRAVFLASCSQCHGSGAAGAKGYPNLLDDDWLWGGSIEDIAYTVNYGIRNEIDPDARWSEMPAFGDILEKEQIDQVVQYVTSLSSTDYNVELAALGAAIVASIAAGIYPGYEEAVAGMVQIARSCDPEPARAELYREKYERYQQALETMIPFWKQFSR